MPDEKLFPNPKAIADELFDQLPTYNGPGKDAPSTFPGMFPPAPVTVDLPTAQITSLNIDDIKPNTIIVINIDVDSPEQKMAVAPVFAKLLSPFASKLREKGVTVMLMALNESIELVSEADMNQAGWEKKAKSLIINPFER